MVCVVQKMHWTLGTMSLFTKWVPTLAVYGITPIKLATMNLGFRSTALCTTELCEFLEIANKKELTKNRFQIHVILFFVLSTNVPVESMGFFYYPFKKRGQRSFVRHEEVLQFYHNYANDHNLHRVIRFRNYVVNVRPLPDDRWQVINYLCCSSDA